MTTELHRPMALDRVGPHGSEAQVTASPHELQVIAARLRVVALSRLYCAFKVRRVGETTIEAQGMLRAEVTETCVVSLDPFDHEVRETFTVHFVPAGTEDDDPDPDAVDQIPFAAGTIDLGEAAVEQLALALDPYPRRPGAELAAGLTPEPAGPFAGLSARRPKS